MAKRFFFANTVRQQKFKQELKYLLTEMSRSILRDISKAYIEPIALDGISNDILERIIEKGFDRYYILFEELTRNEMEEIIASSISLSRNKLNTLLRNAGITVRQTYDAQTIALLRSSINESIEKVVTIPANYLEEVSEIIQEATLRGRDFEYATKKLTEAKIKSKNNAELFVRDQVNKANEAVSRSVCQAAGITKGRWIHVPGAYSSRETHIEFNRQIFDLDVGLYDETIGKYTLPAKEPYCNCTYEPFIGDIINS